MGFALAAAWPIHHHAGAGYLLYGLVSSSRWISAVDGLEPQAYA